MNKVVLRVLKYFFIFIFPSPALKFLTYDSRYRPFRIRLVILKNCSHPCLRICGCPVGLTLPAPIYFCPFLKGHYIYLMCYEWSIFLSFLAEGSINITMTLPIIHTTPGGPSLSPTANSLGMYTVGHPGIQGSLNTQLDAGKEKKTSKSMWVPSREAKRQKGRDFLVCV